MNQNENQIEDKFKLYYFYNYYYPEVYLISTLYERNIQREWYFESKNYIIEYFLITKDKNSIIKCKPQRIFFSKADIIQLVGVENQNPEEYLLNEAKFSASELLRYKMFNDFGTEKEYLTLLTKNIEFIEISKIRLLNFVFLNEFTMYKEKLEFIYSKTGNGPFKRFYEQLKQMNGVWKDDKFNAQEA